ncbi:MAG: hypothetical protein U1F43_28220 [Myxococcota bacterium]
MKRFIGTLLFVLSFGALAEGCLVREADGDVDSVSVGLAVRAQPRCGPAYYWNGERCVHRGHRYGHHHRHYYYYDYD